MKKIIHLLLVVILLSSCEEVVNVEKVIKPVKYVTVGDLDNDKTRTFSGTTVAGNAIDLSFRANGVILELPISVGSKVKKGELIARLDNVQAKLALEKSISALRSAKSSMQTEKSNLDRVKVLFERGSNSLRDYEKAKNSYQSSLDQYESAKRNLSIQRSEISYGVIYAPNNGIITTVDGELNENTSAGKIIAILNAGDDINIELGIPESIINKITLDMNVGVSVLEKEMVGRVFEISPVTDENSGNYMVKISIKDLHKDVKQGMTAMVTFSFNEPEKNEIIIPVNSVGEDVKGNFVFLIDDLMDGIGIAKKKTIKIGRLTESGFVVENGLDDGDRICTAGLQTLLDGQKVKIN